ncbi:hypothetical protein [Roseospira goensis]|uniref:Structural protein P5 n=1 Tax=Roseospira goensis TaxID=391922 RepID=A0A7W6S3R7_9PROT|nr:hypothetical protein [Roseospira goensis]MBB4287604.1 hypothetical protein [Roseospira goensis]
MTAPRGIRNHNPGNIERGAPWQGLAEPDEMTPVQRMEDRFAVFKAPEWGIRAIARVLITYQDKHGLRTVRDMLNRWAPPVENDTGAYVERVARDMGVSPDTEINVHCYDPARLMVEAIIAHENGQQPYPNDVIDRGLMLAGIEPPKVVHQPPLSPGPKPFPPSEEDPDERAHLVATLPAALADIERQAGALKDRVRRLLT